MHLLFILLYVTNLKHNFKFILSFLLLKLTQKLIYDSKVYLHVNQDLMKFTWKKKKKNSGLWKIYFVNSISILNYLKMSLDSMPLLFFFFHLNLVSFREKELSHLACLLDQRLGYKVERSPPCTILTLKFTFLDHYFRNALNFKWTLIL